MAIVPDEGQATLDACRSYLEAWLRPLAERTGEVRIHAEKRMTPRAYVGKSRKTLPLSAFQSDKTWHKLFDPASNYQTVLASIFPKDAEYPIAGIGLQVGMEQYEEQWREHHEQQLADTLSKMRGRPFDRAPVVNTVHVFNWVLNHADCYSVFGHIDWRPEGSHRPLRGSAPCAAGMAQPEHMASTCSITPTITIEPFMKSTVF